MSDKISEIEKKNILDEIEKLQKKNDYLIMNEKKLKYIENNSKSNIEYYTIEDPNKYSTCDFATQSEIVSLMIKIGSNINYDKYQIILKERFGKLYGKIDELEASKAILESGKSIYVIIRPKFININGFIIKVIEIWKPLKMKIYNMKKKLVLPLTYSLN